MEKDTWSCEVVPYYSITRAPGVIAYPFDVFGSTPRKGTYGLFVRIWFTMAWNSEFSSCFLGEHSGALSAKHIVSDFLRIVREKTKAERITLSLDVNEPHSDVRTEYPTQEALEAHIRGASKGTWRVLFDSEKVGIVTFDFERHRIRF